MISMGVNSQNSYRYSIGVPVYNEEGHLQNFINSILNQKDFTSYEIIFILSGCTDNSEAVIERCIGNDNRYKLLRQEKREGKASAINAFLKEAKGEILILISADTVLDKNCLSRIVSVFNDSAVGMTGAHSIPLKNSRGIIYSMNRVLWDLHHQLCLKKPKLGELIAFRNIIKKIPFDIAADEVYIEAVILKNGYALCYKSDALVYNSCPVRVKDFFLQRMRLFWGHLDVKKRMKYAAASMEVRLLSQVVIRYAIKNIHAVIIVVILCSLEIFIRVIASYQYYRTRKTFPYMYIWPKYNK